MDIYVKNMVCPRCISAVEGILKRQDLPYESVDLGHIVLKSTLNEDQSRSLDQDLLSAGFERIDDRKKQLTEQIKNIIVKIVHGQEEDKEKLSERLRQELHLDYKHLSKVFSEVTGQTIEKFYIQHRIERVKELISYDELSLKEIAFQMGYSSEAYLSNQFKKITGLTPSQFKSSIQRKSLDQI